jgi:2-dehydro-3-deoxyphosphogluconate aldolase / (4S)-4-hydroxy-2-oxoglutarate aldolase
MAGIDATAAADMAGVNATTAGATDAFGRSPVIPVVTIDDPRRAVGLARALVAGGLTAIEVTLRTPAALDCIRAVAGEVDGLVVGAGTVLDARQADEAREAGARFLVSPGATDRLIDAVRAAGCPWLPGAGTVAEAMRLAEAGFVQQKFFPAEPSGGAAFLKAVAPVLPGIRFCPTGGVDAKNAPAYLALSNVFAVGGSWIAPATALAAGDYAAIERLAREATALRG